MRPGFFNYNFILHTILIYSLQFTIFIEFSILHLSIIFNYQTNKSCHFACPLSFWAGPHSTSLSAGSANPRNENERSREICIFKHLTVYRSLHSIPRLLGTPVEMTSACNQIILKIVNYKCPFRGFNGFRLEPIISPSSYLTLLSHPSILPLFQSQAL